MNVWGLGFLQVLETYALSFIAAPPIGRRCLCSSLFVYPDLLSVFICVLQSALLLLQYANILPDLSLVNSGSMILSLSKR